MFRSVGVSAEGAAEMADVLIASDLRGNDSHGVSNALRHYIQGYLDGGPPTAQPTFRVVRDGPATAVVDADGALGIHVGTFAMNLAIEKAKEYGVGSVAVRNAGHFGAIGFFTQLAAQAGCLGQCFVGGVPSGNAGAGMVPTFGAEGRLSTNPVAWSAPAKI